MEFPLTPEGRKELLLLYKGCKELKLGNRINMVLLLDEGYTLAQVAKILRFDEDTVASWRDRYKLAKDMQEFKQTHYHTPVCLLSDEQLDIIKQYILNSYITKSSMLIDFIKKEYDIIYSPSGIRKLMVKMGFSYKQLNLFPGNASVEDQKVFEDDYYKTEAQLAEDEAIMFLDGAHPIHNVRPTKTWSLRGFRDYILSNTGRHRVNINGAYDPHHKVVIATMPHTINAATTIELLEKIKNERPGLSKIHLYADNARYYRSTQVVEYLENNPVFKMHHLPPYSPNLNLIERLWKYMRNSILNAKYYATAKEFEKAINDFFDNIHLKKEDLGQQIGTRFHSLT
jgi:transposase